MGEQPEPSRESKRRVMSFSKVFSDAIDEKEKLVPRKLVVCDTIVSSTVEGFQVPALTIPVGNRHEERVIRIRPRGCWLLTLKTNLMACGTNVSASNAFK
jgi:hypothetical protein